MGDTNDLPIIVGGCHRSGTSLVRRVLNAHSRIYCGPEVKFLRDFHGDYIGDPIRYGRFMASARSILPEQALFEILGHAYLQIVEEATVRAGKARWADKNPENVLYLDDWGRLLGNKWVLVHVIRNPLDTLASIKEARFPFVIPTALDERIAFYYRYNEAGLRFARRYPDRYYRLVYERLVSSPQEEIERLMTWLGEVFEQEQLDYNKKPHQCGLEDRKVSEARRIHDRSIGRWRHVLTKWEAHRIWAATEDLWTEMASEFVSHLALDLQPTSPAFWIRVVGWVKGRQ